MSVMFGWLGSAAFSSACCTAQPVASATWTIRRWLCPPSRVRCQRDPARLNGPRARPAARSRRGVLDHELDERRSLSPLGDHRVLDMLIERVARLSTGGDAALSPGVEPGGISPLASTPTFRRRELSAALSPAAPDRYDDVEGLISHRVGGP
jgi:hypothetical protein